MLTSSADVAMFKWMKDRVYGTQEPLDPAHLELQQLAGPPITYFKCANFSTCIPHAHPYGWAHDQFPHEI
ncbi:hypothetical protein PanWU01x14_039040 [Parasponia andersonii]|uniref:Uncharacterized protein n=1 Tax=Parasponia andersonii TaxID=3476 RepID=A0A2P5DRN0_PARAD|nr:hypothetical protein PanWU01x14_039040 [Parasponia andersonii]